jgi:hypothetical protein
MGYTIFKQLPKGGTPGFNLGWLHGCQSGLGTNFGGAIFLSSYSWSRDVDIALSKPNINKIRAKYTKELPINWNNDAEVKKNFSDYNRIFWGAYKFCKHTALGILQTASMNPPLPGQTRYDPSAHSLSNIYRMHGKGDPRIGNSGLW